MTVGEIYAIADYKINQGKPKMEDKEELYQMLMEARNG